MIPSPVYCRRCGGFTGGHQMTEDGKNVSGEHKHLEDCVEKLYEYIRSILDREKREER